MIENVAKTYRILQEAGHKGLPCPTNAEIAEQLGVRSIGTTSNYVSDLEKRGLIEVERTSRTREILVVASGKRLRSAQKPPRVRAPINSNGLSKVQPRRLSQDDIANRVVDNRVCFHCEVRAVHHDKFGCGRVM